MIMKPPEGSRAVGKDTGGRELSPDNREYLIWECVFDLHDPTHINDFSGELSVVVIMTVL